MRFKTDENGLPIQGEFANPFAYAEHAPRLLPDTEYEDFCFYTRDPQDGDRQQERLRKLLRDIPDAVPLDMQGIVCVAVPYYGTLCDYETGNAIRPATKEERAASDAEIEAGCPEGAFPVDWRSEGGWYGEDSRICYVDP